jgi:hypothetical protein
MIFFGLLRLVQRLRLFPTSWHRKLRCIEWRPGRAVGQFGTQRRANIGELIVQCQTLYER